MNKHIAGSVLFLLACIRLTGAPSGPTERSVSASQQFVIYCKDPAMRMAVSGYAEETKAGITGFLGQSDHWKIPIVINLARADATQPDQPISQVRLMVVEGGARKIELNVALGGDLVRAQFLEQLVRAILLAEEYCDKPITNDATFVEPPFWLIEGFTSYLRNRNTDVDVDLYKSLLQKNHLPPIGDFLSRNGDSGMNAASLKLYQAYAVSLLNLVAGLPKGPESLSAYIAHLPMGGDTPTRDLLKHFPALGNSEPNLEKWWTLSMAGISASDRYKGLSLSETEERLVNLLKFSIPTGKSGETKEFQIEDFKKFIKLPQARGILNANYLNLQLLGTQANPLFRPIVVEYQTIVQELQKRKIKHTAERLKNIAKYREMLLTRMEQIADYLNWFEATKFVNKSDSFDDYMRTANELSSDLPKREDTISRYLDGIELQME